MTKGKIMFRQKIVSILMMILSISVSAVELEVENIEKPISPGAVSEIKGYIQSRIDTTRINYIHNFDIDGNVRLFEEKTHRNWWWPGEQAGKWLETAVLCSEQTGDGALREKAKRVLDRLIASQEPGGYLGITDPELRTSQKPLRGMDAYELYFMLHALISVNELWNNDDALQSAKELGDYFVEHIGPGKAEFWPVGKEETIAGHKVHASLEGTLLVDPMLRLYMATGEQRYLDWSLWVISCIDRWSGFDTYSKLARIADGEMRVHELLSGRGIHAHTIHMNLLGLLRLYQITGEESYLRKVQGAWRDIVETHMYITGAVSSDEGYWNETSPRLTDKDVETCATMSWILLNQYLLELTADSEHADIIERLIWNHVFAAQTVDGDTFRYFTPLNGSKPKGMYPEIRPNCCTASGPRLVSMIPSLIYARGKDMIYINQFIPSSADLRTNDGIKVKLTQRTDYPSDEKITILVDPDKSASFTLNVRLPGWCKNPDMTVNRETIDGLIPGQYVQIQREWKVGDLVELNLPMKTEWARRSLQGQSEDVRALTRGPLVYAVDTVWWNDSILKSIGDLPENLADVVRIDIAEELTEIEPPAGRLGPAFQAFAVLPDKKREKITMLPFTNIGIWYKDSDSRPEPDERRYGYAVWLFAAE